MTAPFHLPAKVAVANAKKALEEGRLQFQQLALTWSTGMCKYRPNPTNPNCGCAIGVSLPHDLAIELDGHWLSSVSILVNEGRITTDDRTVLKELQTSHDMLTMRLVANSCSLETAVELFTLDLIELEGRLS